MYIIFLFCNNEAALFSCAHHMYIVEPVIVCVYVMQTARNDNENHHLLLVKCKKLSTER